MHLFEPFIQWYLQSLETGGYWLVALLMAMESSIIPLPSEIVMPPAAHIAVTTGTMTLHGLVIAGTAGSWVGAALMYAAARYLGRPLLARFGRYVLITPQQIVAAENWSRRFGAMGVFVARLLPVIRHLIGIPAGIVRLNFAWYSAATVVGSGVWCSVLVWLGVKAGEDPALMAGEVHAWGVWLGGAAAALGFIYWYFVHRHMK
jgi:membrane protein DedA with SNARE-associated domain